MFAWDAFFIHNILLPSDETLPIGIQDINPMLLITLIFLYPSLFEGSFVYKMVGWFIFCKAFWGWTCSSFIE